MVFGDATRAYAVHSVRVQGGRTIVSTIELKRLAGLGYISSPIVVTDQLPVIQVMGSRDWVLKLVVVGRLVMVVIQVLGNDCVLKATMTTSHLIRIMR